VSNPNDLLFIKRHAHLFRGQTLEIGSKKHGKWGMDLDGVIDNRFGIDMEAGDGVDLVHDMMHPIGRQFDGVICCNVLEHTAKPWVVAQNVLDALRPGGVLIASTPWIWRRHNYPNDYCRFSCDGLKALFDGVRWVDEAYASTHDGEFLTDQPWRQGFALQGQDGTKRSCGVSELAYVCGIKE
jgi:SAM-dependent methyltransferase